MIVKSNAHITIKSYSKRHIKQINMMKTRKNNHKSKDGEYYCFCEYINKDNNDIICYCTNKKTNWDEMNMNIQKLQELGIIEF